MNASNVQPERKRAIPAMHQMLPCYWSDNHRLCAVECQAGELSQFKGAGMQDGPSLAMRPLKRTESWNEKMAFASPSNISITCRTAAFAGCESPRRSEEPLLLCDNEVSLDAHQPHKFSESQLATNFSGATFRMNPCKGLNWHQEILLKTKKGGLVIVLLLIHF